jgi:thiosulfate/3-mercaptopyruvate sulfurtransferase
VDADWKYKSDEELLKIFKDKNVDMNKQFITSCGSGLTAAMISFGAHLLGKEKTFLYDKSWAEYGKIDQ